MYTQFNGSSYYRANPFYQQGYLPDSALKNRKNPANMVELPQGDQHFQPSNKKHFQRIGYYSTIGQEKIMGYENNTSPARQRQYFRNLNIEDIEGASPNTLISKAVKNKLKAKAQLQKRQNQEKYMKQMEKMKYYQRIEDDRKRREALAKMKKNGGQMNYHQKVMRLRTQQEQHINQQNQNHKIQNSSQINGHSKQMEDKLKQIQQLQYQLKKLKQQTKPQNNIQEQNNRQQFYRQSNMANYQANYQNNLKRQDRQQYGQISYQTKKQQNNKESKANYPYSLQNQNYSGNIDNIKKQRSNTISNRQQQPKSVIQNYSQISRTKNNNTDITYAHLSPKQTKQQHRKFNPTFLSYGSQSIGLAGKNIVGF